MELSFKLPVFEGPMDLLLHLIDKNKINIYDIPIAELTDQYFAYIDQMDTEDMDVMSEFLLMACTLLDIKARMLLPPEKDEEGEEIDPRTELVQRLLEYKLFKHMAQEMKVLEGRSGGSICRAPSVPDSVKSYREPVDPDQVLSGCTLEQLQAVFLEVMRRQEDRVDPIRSSFGKIERERVNAGEVMNDVRRSLSRRRSCTFRSLLTKKKSRMYTVVAFLTVLELMKMGCIGVEQEDPFSEIMITNLKPDGWADVDGALMDYE